MSKIRQNDDSAERTSVKFNWKVRKGQNDSTKQSKKFLT